MASRATQPAAEPCGYPLVACRSNLREPAPARTEGTHTSGRQGQWQRSWPCLGYTTGSFVSSTRTSVPGSPPTRRRTILEGYRSGLLPVWGVAVGGGGQLGGDCHRGTCRGSRPYGWVGDNWGGTPQGAKI